MEFIDLFCGIGGFHQAIENEGGKCVLACDIDKDAMKVYETNYNIKVFNDITKLNENLIPKHDLLCAGFPCQSFSKAGKQNGFSETRGTLFFDIERILRHSHPKYILLENVKNITTHDDGNTWRVITNTLKDIGYRLTENPVIISPVDIGTPQHRPRAVIAGMYDPGNIESPLSINLNKIPLKSIYDILENNADSKYSISKKEEEILEIWDEFYQGVSQHTIGFPIWADVMRDNSDISYHPKWKQEFIEKNRSLYNNNKQFLDEWFDKHNNLEDFNPSFRKFEWQASNKISNIWEGLIQFRPSGIRVKKPDTFPALVAMVQIPIIGKYRRRLTPRECARLQNFDDSFISSTNDQQAYKQFGNAVNVRVIQEIYRELMKN